MDHLSPDFVSLAEDDTIMSVRHKSIDFNDFEYDNVVEIYGVDSYGEKNLHYKGRNLVVNNGKKILAKLISGDVSYAITRAMYGNCSFQQGEITNMPATPLRDNESLIDPNPIEAQLTVESVANIPGTSDWMTIFRVVLGHSQGNGPIPEGGGVATKYYSEVGLFSANGTMYARKVFPSFQKWEGFQLETHWPVVFRK
jgi:hypothetical protein